MQKTDVLMQVLESVRNAIPGLVSGGGDIRSRGLAAGRSCRGSAASCGT